MALIDKLSAIGNGFRESRGTTVKYTLDEMAALAAEPVGGGGGNEPTDEELVITGDCSYRFANGGWNWFISKYSNRMTTKDITNMNSMFSGSGIQEIPFQLNINSCENFSTCFSITSRETPLRVCPKIRGSIKWGTLTSFASMLDDCCRVRDFEDLFTSEMLDGFSSVKVVSSYSSPKPIIFSGCRSLRTIPSWWYKFKLNEESTTFPTYSNGLYNATFEKCVALDEVANIPVWTCSGAQTSNMFRSTFLECGRLSRITFETNADGTSKVAKWKAQTIDISNYTGYVYLSSTYIGNYNSGITMDKEVKDDATYQALKNDPDWFATKVEYSRYNHDSAVETINSLPDTSAYLATAGGTNTIKFKGAHGSLTDGGAINTLTEEEIAVATAKGWTVSLV